MLLDSRSLLTYFISKSVQEKLERTDRILVLYLLNVGTCLVKIYWQINHYYSIIKM